MKIQAAIEQLIKKHDLSQQDMTDIMSAIMTGNATASQIAGFLVALRMKGETVDEITAAAIQMRQLATPCSIDEPHLTDIVGTGGDGSHTFNVSTASAFVAAAAGANVAKHGNRSVSSRSGSADVLEAAGVHLELTPQQLEACVKQLNIGFLFAPSYHPAMKHAALPRRELGVRTLFNLLGPLTNPAQAPYQLIGVYNKAWVEPVAEVLKQLGSKHALVVHGENGLDEISLEGKTFVAELNNNTINTYELHPTDLGLPIHSLETIQVKDAQESYQMILDVFNNKRCPARDVILMNAGAAIYVADLAKSIAEGIEKAKYVLEQGLAKKTLEQLAKLTHTLVGK